MTDLICRVCGEGWDSTGGLHYSHSDLTWWQYEQLVHGVGCPCCAGERPEGLDPETRASYYNRWLDSIHYLSEGMCFPEQELEPPTWCFTSIWSEENDHRVIPLFFRPPEDGVEREEDPKTWRWVGEKPEPTEKFPASDPRYALLVARAARTAVNLPPFPPGCRYLQREDTRAMTYGLNVPHAPYFDNYFAGAALVPRYRDEHDEPTWQECMSNKSGFTMASDMDIKHASELAFLGDDADDDALYYSVAERWIDDDKEADLVSRANYEVVEKAIEKHGFGVLYEGPQLWVQIGTFKEGRGSFNLDALKFCYETDAALEDYPCLCDETASRLEWEGQKEQIEEWLKSNDLEAYTGLCDVTSAMLVWDLPHEQSPFWKDSGEFEPDPDVADVAEALVDHIPCPSGYALIATPSAGVWFLSPEFPGLVDRTSDHIPGFILRDDGLGIGPVAFVPEMPKNQLSEGSYGYLRSALWDDLPPRLRVDTIYAIREREYADLSQ